MGRVALHMRALLDPNSSYVLWLLLCACLLLRHIANHG
jgi:hypothetical protein